MTQEEQDLQLELNAAWTIGLAGAICEFHPLSDDADAFSLQHGLEMEVRKVGDDWCVYVGVRKVLKTCIKDDEQHSKAMLRRAIVELSSLVCLERKRAGAV